MTNNRLCQIAKTNDILARRRNDAESLRYLPFNQFGDFGKAYELFGDRLPAILKEMNARLAA